jgi:hypothetical protein
MTKYQTSENAKIKDHILCTCKNMALQSHDPLPPLTAISATIQKFLLDPIILEQHSLEAVSANLQLPEYLQ